MLGMVLPDDDLIADVEQLQLETALGQGRSPVPQLPLMDSPGIGFVEPDEVLQEALRLSRSNLSFPADEGIEEGRSALVR